MIVGNVLGMQARIGVTFRVPHQPDIEIEFVVDTGFEGALTLPPAAIAALGLPRYHKVEANLADDTRTETDVYRATIVWDGREYLVAVLSMGKRPLLGTALLAGRELVAQFADGGLVTIDDL